MYFCEQVPDGNGWESTLTDEQRKYWGKFLIEVTLELVYHTVYEFKAIRETKLRKWFKRRFRYDPMEFFYWGQFYQHYCTNWYEFLKKIPGLDSTSNVIKIQQSMYSTQTAYEKYNATTLVSYRTGGFEDESRTSMATYREFLLLSACKLVTKDNVIDVNRKDKQGNTAVHFIGALPGDSSRLVKYLLHVGANPAMINDAELNLVHIIVGRIKTSYGLWGQQHILERIESISWTCSDRVASLSELPRNLLKSLGKDDNTTLHECVFSIQTIPIIEDATSLIQERSKVEEEIAMASQLLESGASISTPNAFGLFPLHFAFNSTIFEFLLSKGANCQRTSHPHDETPYLFILKYFVGLALVHAHSETAGETEEIRNHLDDNIRCYSQLFVRSSPIRKATFVLSQLTKLAKIPAVKSTIWDADQNQITPLFLLLMFARVSCYWPNPERSRSSTRRYSVRRRGWEKVWQHLQELEEFENALVDCVIAVVDAGSKEDLSRQGFLHILLDLGESDGIKIISRMTSVVKCLRVLIEHGADVNERDKNLRTALHLICTYYRKCPKMYQECAKLLVECGAHMDIKNKWGQSVKDCLMRTDPHLKAVVSKVMVTRKVYSSTRRHNNTVKQLANERAGLTVVAKCRFKNTEPIGTGAFSNIYAAIKDEAENEESGTIRCREVALKRLEKAKIGPREIDREVKALLAISTKCENIVDYYETVKDENFFYIILELMEGDLRQLVADTEMRKILSESQIARQAALDVVKGLAYLHEKNFLHRDLKPGNVLYKVDPRLCLKIADFGLTKEIGTSTASSTACGSRPAGTRCWMAPELVNLTSSKHTKESDVFALGLVLHYLLALGKHPFASTSPQQPEYLIEANIANGSLSLCSSLSEDGKNFLRYILAKYPIKRPFTSKLPQHPFLWSEKKKIEFLKAVGDQKEAARPTEHANSRLQKCLQNTQVGDQFISSSWNNHISILYDHITRSWIRKRYRTSQVIDLMRFVRNAYAHKEEQPETIKSLINDGLLLKAFPTLVLEVYIALNNEGFLEDPERTNIQDALSIE